MYSYHNLVKKVLENGISGDGYKQLYGESFETSFHDGFPILTSIEVPFKNLAAEAVWALSGNDNYSQLKYLCDYRVNRWDNIAYEYHNRMRGIGRAPQLSVPGFNRLVESREMDVALGPVYSKQLRHWDDSIDQLGDMIKHIEQHPDSNMMFIISLWDPRYHRGNLMCAESPRQYNWVFYINQADKTLNMIVNQSECNLLEDFPLDISLNALILAAIARTVKLKPGKILWNLYHVRIREEYLEVAERLLEREIYKRPHLKISKAYSVNRQDLFKQKEVVKMFELSPYDYGKPLKFIRS